MGQYPVVRATRFNLGHYPAFFMPPPARIRGMDQNPYESPREKGLQLRAQRTRKQWQLWMVVILSALVSLSLYVLSVGPVLWIANNGHLWLGEALEGFYAPLVWVAGQWRLTDYALKMYIAWWLM
jgi:hypothetical protein